MGVRVVLRALRRKIRVRSDARKGSRTEKATEAHATESSVKKSQNPPGISARHAGCTQKKESVTTSTRYREAAPTSGRISNGFAADATPVKQQQTKGEDMTNRPPVSDRSYFDAIDKTASDALALAVETSRSIERLAETVRMLSDDVDRLVRDTDGRSTYCASCRREVDGNMTSLGQTLRIETREAMGAVNDRITKMINKTYWVAGFAAAGGIVVGVIIK